MTAPTHLEYPGFGFDVLARDAASRARRGRLRTPHGAIETPAFIFCATKGSIKSVTLDDLERIGPQIILSNTYHMMLDPGGERVAARGGLHGFIGWQGPMLTDSGGFQIFSLGHGSVADEIKGRRDTGRERTLLEIDEEGAVFRSYLDGKIERLSPERSIEVQRQLGADLIVAFDECTPFHIERQGTALSTARTHRWADRSLEEFARRHDGRQALMGVIQGGVYEDLRRQSAEFIASRPFFGHAVGGSLGAEKEQMYDVVDLTMGILRASGPENRPVHLLGIGGVDDIWHGVERGIDTFECVSPTRIARHGWALCRDEPGFKINLRNARFKADDSPVHGARDGEPCDCPVCERHSRAFLHHLIRAGEIQGMRLLTLANLHFMTRLMREVRLSLEEGRFAETKQEWLG